MVKAKPTRRRLFKTASTIQNDTNLSQFSHQPPRDPPINHVESLRERPTDDAGPLRDAPDDHLRQRLTDDAEPLSHVQAYMLPRQRPPNFDSIDLKTLRQYTYITERYERFLKENAAEFDNNHSVLDRD